MKLTFIERVMFFLGMPKTPGPECECFKCKTKYGLIDLGDGDVICQTCWYNWIPTIV